MRCLVLLFTLVVAACGVPQSEFKNTDITGADFGRTLALTDHNGKPRTLAEFNGKVVAVFFGFTQCPDACPTTLATLRAVKDKLGADGDKLQVLFVTVDPERDTAPLLGKYVTTFDPSFLGLSGDAEATSRVAKEFKVFYQKVPGKTPETYSIDHTATTYLYDPRGRLRLFVRYGEGVEPIVADVQRLLAGK
jgi:protein SCO1/2